MSRPTLYSNLGYRRWTTARDQALERIHFRAQVEMTFLLSKYIEAAISFGSHSLHILQGRQNTAEGKMVMGRYQQRLKHEAAVILPSMLEVYGKMRKKTALLAYRAESEGLARVMFGPVGRLKPMKPADTAKTTGPDPIEVVGLMDRALDRLASKFYDALNTSRIMHEDVKKGLTRLDRQIPPVRAYQNPQKVLARPKMREAAKDPKPALSFSIPEAFDQSDWDEVVKDATDQWVPPYRKPSDVFDIPDEDLPDQATEVYGWEIEKQMMQDFIDEVRSQTMDAGKNLGVTDFVWIAILDDKTDECCRKRDGLLLKEIEAKLDGDWKDDECDADSPPAHFNCRCSIAPVTTDDVPPSEGVDPEDFSEWLRNGTAAA